jgi:hypothetical protein
MCGLADHVAIGCRKLPQQRISVPSVEEISYVRKNKLNQFTLGPHCTVECLSKRLRSNRSLYRTFLSGRSVSEAARSISVDLLSSHMPVQYHHIAPAVATCMPLPTAEISCCRRLWPSRDEPGLKLQHRRVPPCRGSAERSDTG